MIHKAIRFIVAVAIMLASFVVLTPPTPAFAAAIVVASSGGNFTTIQAAINNAHPGDTIQVRAGTYNENLNISLMGSAVGGSTGNLAIVKDGVGTVTIGGTDTKLTNSGAFNGSLLVDGLTFSTSSDVVVIQLSGLAGLSFSNNTVNGGNGTGYGTSHGLQVTIASGSGNYNIANNIFNSTIVADGVRIVASGGTPNVTISSNTFSGGANMTYGVQVFSSNSAAIAAAVTGNTFSDPFTGGLIFDSQNTSTFTGYAANNTFANFSRLSATGLATYAENSSTMNVTLTGNQTSGTFNGAGLWVNMFAGATVNAIITNNTLAVGASGGPIDAIAFEGTNTPTSIGTVQIVNNTITRADGAGIYIRALGMDPALPNPTYYVTINNNTISGVNTGGYLSRAGIYVAAGEAAGDTGTDVRVNLNGNSVGATGMKLAQNSATACYTGSDGAATTRTGTWSTCVSAPPQPLPQTPPTANDDTASATSAVATTINVLGNDSNVAALSSFTALSVEGGTVTRDDNSTPGNLADDKLIYTSLSGFSGTDRFYYTVRSSDGLYATAAVTLTVTIITADIQLVSKSDGAVTVAPGDLITYTLTYTNAGPMGATNVVLSETVPLNTVYSGSGWTCIPNSNPGSSCTLNLGTVAQNSGGTAQFVVTVANPVPAGVTQISNSASISTSAIDPTPGNNSASDTTPVNAAPDLTLTKSDGGASVAPGSTVAYTLTYANAGNQGATGVVLTETVPANSTFNAGASSAGWSCAPNNNAGSTCTLTIGALNGGGASGSRTFAVTVVNPVAAGVTQISNTASVADDGSNGTDLTPGNNSASDTTPVNAAPDLTLSKSDGGASVAPGGTVTYTLTYANAGNQGATGVVLTETVPANSTFNAGASTAGWSCAPNNNAGSTCTLTIGALASGANGSATFAVTVVNPVAAGVAQISNTASVADDGSNGSDPTPGNNSASDTTPVNAAPDLSLSKSDGGASVAPGGTVVYTLTYANAGNQGATGVGLAETVPANSTFNAGASTAGWSCVPNNNTGSTCTLIIGALASGANGSATFAVAVVNPVAAGVTQISNTASVADDGSNGADPTPGNNSASDTTPINAAPDLQITKDDAGVTFLPGDTITYTIAYTNAGNQGATGVVVTDVVPANTTFVGSGWTCAPNNNAGSACTRNVGSLAAGTSGAATFVVNVNNPAPGVISISNTVVIGDDGANGADPNPGDNSATQLTPIANQPPTILSVNVAPNPISENGVVTVTGTFTDPDVLDTHVMIIQWGDGLSTTLNLATGVTAYSATHQYPDDNPSGTSSDSYPIGLTLTDPIGNSDTDSASVTVNNLAPTLRNLNATTVDENGTTTLTGNITDVGTQDTFTLTVDWGDGSAAQTFTYLAGTTMFTRTHQYLDDNPSGTSSDAYPIGLTLTDDDLGSNVTTTLVTVNNVAPTLANLAVAPINEGSTAQLTGRIGDVGAQDTFTLTVNWGDGNIGTFAYPAGTTTFTQTHQYLDDNPSGTSSDVYSIGLALTDDDTGTMIASVPITVTNLPPTLSNVAATSSVNENGSTTLTGNIGDVGTQDTFTLTVNWGDGNNSTFTYPAGTTAFTQTHQYLDDNPSGTSSDVYPIGLVLTDDDLGSTTANTSVTVNNLAPTLSNGAATSPVNENGSTMLKGNIGDVGTQDTFTLTVNWGDGNNSTFTYPAGTTAFTQTHQYLDDNPSGTPSDVYPIGLLLTDDDTGGITTTISITIDNVAPTVNAGLDRAGVTDHPIAFTGAYTDPGSLDTHTIVWDFGDGVTTTGMLTPTHNYAQPGTYTATLTVTDDDAGVGSDQTIVRVSSSRHYLPLVLNSYVAAPDLVVTRLQVGGGSAQVVIKNQGNQPTSDAFYVDVYIDPNPVPNGVNQIWSDGRSQQGLVWGVTNAVQPGESITLTIEDLYYLAAYSAFTMTLPAGTPVYAQVDSYNPFTSYGVVLENHEVSGGPYNNILGPVLSTAAFATVNVARPVTPGYLRLPFRWH